MSTLARSEHARCAELAAWARLEVALLALMCAAGALQGLALARAARADAVEVVGAPLAAFVLVESLFVPLEAWLGARARRGVLLACGAVLFALGALATAAVGGEGAWAVAGAGAGLAFGATAAPALQRLAAHRLGSVATTAATCVLLVAACALVLVAAGAAPGVLAAALLVGTAQSAVLVVMALFVVDPPCGDLAPGGGP